MVLRQKIYVAIALGLAASTPLALAQNHEHQWQIAKTVSANFKAVAAQPDIEVFSAPGLIMVKVTHEVEVRIYTILGKLISAQVLQPGTFQYEMDSHGIYIIKTDETSCKIAI